jgi:two-component system, NarL family, nitrate/nitrite response regulator NarL
MDGCTPMVRTMIAIDVPFYRDGLAQLLTGGEHAEVVSVLSLRDDIVRDVQEKRPDVVLLDITAPAAMRQLQRLRALPSPPRIVALLVGQTPDDVLVWAEAGITAYVTREATLEELVRVLQGAARDEAYCSPQIAAVLMRRLSTLARRQPPGDARTHSLTVREQEIFALLAKGLSNKAIGRALGISSATAKNHVHNILDKMQLHRRAEAAAYAQYEVPAG